MKKIISALALCASLFAAGCSKSNTLKMGTNAAFPPFEFVEGDKVVGFDATMGELIARDFGKELEIQDMAFDSLIAALQAGSIDFIAAGMTATDERRQSVDFSEPYFSSKQVIIVQAGNDSVKTVSDLDGKVIGCQSGTTGEIYINDELTKAKAKGFKSGIDASLDLINGAIDAIILDELPSREIVKNNADTLKIVDDDFCTDVYAIAVKKGNTELLDSINKTISTMKANGNYDKLLDAFMPADGNIKILSASDL